MEIGPDFIAFKHSRILGVAESPQMRVFMRAYLIFRKLLENSLYVAPAMERRVHSARILVLHEAIRGKAIKKRFIFSWWTFNSVLHSKSCTKMHMREWSFLRGSIVVSLKTLAFFTICMMREMFLWHCFSKAYIFFFCLILLSRASDVMVAFFEATLQ